MVVETILKTHTSLASENNAVVTTVPAMRTLIPNILSDVPEAYRWVCRH